MDTLHVVNGHLHSVDASDLYACKLSGEHGFRSIFRSGPITISYFTPSARALLSPAVGHDQPGIDLVFSGLTPAPYSVWSVRSDSDSGLRLLVDLDGNASVPELQILVNGSAAPDKSENPVSAKDASTFTDSLLPLPQAGPRLPSHAVLDDFLESFAPEPIPLVNYYDGTEEADFFHGRPGEHTVNGGLGSDTVSYLRHDAPVIVFLAGTTPAPVLVGGKPDGLLSDIENIHGSSYDDILGGDAADNVFHGGPGYDTIDGGPGLDIASYVDVCQPVSVTLNGMWDASVFIGNRLEDILRNIEGIHGGFADDVLTGDSRANVFYGHDGDDVLQGMRGSDRLQGGPGRDTLDGGEGADLADYSDKVDPVVIRLAGSARSVALVGAQEEDSLFSIEDLLGGAGDDHLSGDAASNLLDGGPGINSLTGGAGIDAFIFRFAGLGHRITDFSRAEGDVLDFSGLDADTGTLGNQVFHFSGSRAAPHSLWFDPVSGGLGGHLYADLDGNADQPEFSVFLEGVEHVSREDFSRGTFVLSPIRRGVRELSFDGTVDDIITVDLGVRGYWGGNLKAGLIYGSVDPSIVHVTTGAGDDHLIGNAQANILSAGSGDDHLNGGVGEDVLIGGEGKDIFVYNSIDDSGDVIVDFSREQGDCLDLTAVDADVHQNGHQALILSGCEPRAHAVWYEPVADGNGVHALADVDGDARPDFFVTLYGIDSLVIQDFIF
ncbi:hypothetical protein AY555_05160 [Haematospirillum jordaniae]|uniref:Peptidase M10 serralysin C-terminal domain-containing protein n=1 Tax=Haematospirillum jordaniae TaxID=1549855 RepID=A0A143DEX0_9PROT|nr:hypothetical protein AY555_05160 [Haematospirillum jordaniae]